MDLEQKMEFLAHEKAIEFSDFDLLEELGCLAALPDDDNKFKLWERYVLGTGLNVKGIEASAKYFYNYQNLKQCEIIAEHFYESIESVFAVHHRDYALAFFNHLSPTFLGRGKDLAKLKQIYERQKDSENSHFIKLLLDEIDLFEMTINIKNNIDQKQ